MVRSIILMLALALADVPSGSISGVVLDAGTGAPLEGISVYTRHGLREVIAKTDAQGRYELKDLSPGEYRVSAFNRTTTATKVLTLGPGQELKGVAFRVLARGTITGKILDENKEPVAGVVVWLVHRQYFLGGLRYRFGGRSVSDDRGAYQLTTVMPGRSYLVLAERWPSKMNAVSSAPADPKLRRQAMVPTYFPNSPSIEGAQALVLRPGETREEVDIYMARSPSYCIAGTLDAGARRYSPPL